MRAQIIHDTISIIDANQEALALFECESSELIGKPLIEGIHDKDMRTLVELRLFRIRNKGEMPPAKIPLQFPFMRADRSIFWAEVQTTQITEGECAGLWLSELTYRGED